MNQNYLNSSSYIPNQGTYPPYTNFPGYVDPNSNLDTTNNPQFAENLFTLNKGKKVTVFLSYPDSLEWRDRTFTGTILDSGRDYLLLKTMDGKVIILLLVYLNYALFDEEISY